MPDINVIDDADTLGTFELRALLAIRQIGADNTGPEIIRVLSAMTGRQVSSGAMHTAFNRLTEKGYISSSKSFAPIPKDALRNRAYVVRCIKIEPAGEAAIDRTLAFFRSMLELAGAQKEFA